MHLGPISQSLSDAEELQNARIYHKFFAVFKGDLKGRQFKKYKQTALILNDVHFYHVNYTSKSNKIIGDSIMLYRDYGNEEKEFEYRGSFKIEEIKDFV